MNRLVVIAAVIVAVVTGFYAAYTWAYPTGTLRYRMTVEVVVDGETYVGSSVLEVTYNRTPDLPIMAGRISSRVVGEAVQVDLDEKGRLFVLLTGRMADNATEFFATPEAIPAHAFFGTSVGGLSDETLRQMHRMNLQAELEPEWLPMMVRFRDLGAPSSVEWIRPNNLAATYGLGARFVGATLETTSEPLTTGIRETLPWLVGFNYVSGTNIRDQVDPEKNLTANDFVKGRL